MSLIDIDPFATGNFLGQVDANADGTPDIQAAGTADAGGNLANTGGRHAGEVIPGSSSNDVSGGFGIGAAGETINPGGGYWGDYGSQAMDQAQAQGQYYQTQLNTMGDASQMAGAGANEALTQTGQNAATLGTNAQGVMSALGTNYSSALTGAGQQYAGQIGQTGAGAQNYALGSAGSVDATGQGLGAAGGSLLGQGLDAQGRDISGMQQNALMGIESQAGPSAAQGQLAQATNQNMSQALAMARSGRGWGGSAGAMQQAAGQRVGAQQTAANQSAVLTAQEDAARRQREAQNLGMAGQLATQQAGANDAWQAALNQQGLSAMQAGGNLQLGAGQLGLSGYGQNLSAQQAAANTEIGALGQAAQTSIGANEAGYGMALQGSGQQAQAEQAGGALNLQGYGQAANTYGNAAAYGQNNLTLQGNIEQQGLGWDQQAIQNDLTATGINAGVALQQQNAANQMMGTYISAAGSVLPMFAGSDRNMKEGIEPTNVSIESPSDNIVTPVAGSEQIYDPFSQGVGISGPNQAQGSASSEAARSAAGAQIGKNGSPTPGAIDPKKFGGDVTKFGNAMKDGAKAAAGDISLNPVTGQPWMSTGYGPMPTYSAPMMGTMPPVTSDEREKEALKTIEESPGYSFDYKDPDAMGATDGRQYGIMAQDLEKTPAGRSVVHEVGGKKMVDTSRLTMVNTAAMNALTERLAKIEAKLGGKSKAA